MTYCTYQEVLNVAGITTSEVSEATVRQHIEGAQVETDRITYTTWWARQTTGTASSSTDSTLTLTSAGWTVNAYEYDYIYIISGTGSGQLRQIVSNTADTLTLDEDWETNPDNTSVFEIVSCGHDPRITETFEADEYGEHGPYREYITDRRPIVAVTALSVDDTAESTGSLFVYNTEGAVVTGKSSGLTRFSPKPQGNSLSYLYGVRKHPLHKQVKQLCMTLAAMSVLSSQMGGTHNIPSTISLPEGSLSIGQAYINIKGTRDTIYDAYERLILTVPKYAVLKS
jgi:hypothetical protein